MPIKSKRKNFTALSNEKLKKVSHYREDFLLNLLLSFSIPYTTLSKKDKCNNLLVATFYASKEEQNPRIFFYRKKTLFLLFLEVFSKVTHKMKKMVLKINFLIMHLLFPDNQDIIENIRTQIAILRI